MEDLEFKRLGLMLMEGGASIIILTCFAPKISIN